jgi:hypothetical protein
MRFFLILALVLAAVLSAFTAPARAQPIGWSEFSVRPHLCVAPCEVKVRLSSEFERTGGGPAGKRYLTAELVSSDKPERWADSRRCPGLEQAEAKVAHLNDVVMLSLIQPWHDVTMPPVDGFRYTFHTAGYFVHGHRLGEVTLSSNVDTPLAEWISEMLDVLRPCWGAQAPAGRQSVRP